jgi:transposase
MLEFLTLQSKRRLEKKYLAYDSTSVTSTSELIKKAKYGINKDQNNLPQKNLLILFGEKSLLPVCYRIIPGNITDIGTIKNLITDIEFLKLANIKFVMDRYLFSVKNMNYLFENGYKFLLPLKKNINFVSPMLEIARTEIKNFEHYDDFHLIQSMTFKSKWPVSHIKNKSKQTDYEYKDIYIHIYYEEQKASSEIASFKCELAAARKGIVKGKFEKESHKQLVKKYLKVSHDLDDNIKIGYNTAAIQKQTDNFGYFILLSNYIANSEEALEIYRKRDTVEKAFLNLKNRLEMEGSMVHSETSLEGKSFIHFLSLIFISYVHNHMASNHMYKNDTMQSLFDKLDCIEIFDYAGQPIQYCEITAKQLEIYKRLEIDPPNQNTV